ncbi:NAD(P)/FAD-dependent oxidoreductase [Planotetraspora kaengkrachanensis]|uniref:Oxidoreductase n=1 Tax=Planotetraspora kaengkrachanensis TaxID=575193 RepID=A0A8J3V8I0_9ACTN|nr:FAD-dependent oxidoreductase [Planotetraspora kaengkrachanensis]GIG82106.1 oxidoreductase [Planotetraspora kaengkrachanensis]
MSSRRSSQRIVVLGAGYTGMLTAIRAAGRTRRHGGHVTLVNPSSRFTERLRMHQIATGQSLPDFQIVDVLDGTGVDFVQGWATAIDPDAREVTVTTADGTRVLPYDRLVYALGGKADRTTVPGADVHAHTLDDPASAARLATRLAEIAAAGGTVTVCGAGLTGIEAATEIAESFPSIRTVLLSRDVPGSMMGERARAYLNAALERLHVEVRSGVEITKVLPDAVELSGGELVHTDAALWTTGVRAAATAARSGIATDDHGRIVVDATLRSVSHPAIYAVGDAAAVRQAYGVLHGTCQSGLPTAVHAADAIGRELRGRRPKPFRFGYMHQPVSLGRHDAVIQFTRADDTPRRWHLTGRRAVAYKEFVSSSPMTTYRLSKLFALPSRALWTRGGRANPAPRV